MLRITELKLPLTHSASDLHSAVLYRLQIDLNEFIRYHIFRQGHDARKRDAIMMVYTIDVEVRHEAKILARFADDNHISVTPNTEYHFVTYATPTNKIRHLVIAAGPPILRVRK